MAISDWKRRLTACAILLLDLAAAGVVCTLAFAWQPVFAGGFTPSQQRIWQKSQSLRPKPSTDTTPVTVKVVDVTYRIPRNYLIHLEPMIPTLKLTWPGLKPLTDETRKCFGSLLQSERVGCTSIQFSLHGSRGPITTRSQFLKNFLTHSKIIATRRGRFGYTVYDTGPNEARVETYTKTAGNSSIIFFQCFIQRDNRSAAVCNDWFKLADGNWMHFFFGLSGIASVADVEAGMRELMGSLRVKGGGTP